MAAVVTGDGHVERPTLELHRDMAERTLIGCARAQRHKRSSSDS